MGLAVMQEDGRLRAVAPGSERRAQVLLQVPLQVRRGCRSSRRGPRFLVVHDHLTCDGGSAWGPGIARQRSARPPWKLELGATWSWMAPGVGPLLCCPLPL